MRHVHFLSVLVVLVLWQSPASATVHNVEVYLEGLQEVPPNASPGSGFANVSFDDSSGAMSVTGTFSGLTSLAVAAHVHGYSGIGVNSGVVFGLTVDPATSGNFSGNGVIPAMRIPDVLAGLTYINVHTQNFPGGEIRGQIIIPEPASASLIGLAGMALLRRRR